MVAVVALSLYLARYPFVMWARSQFRRFPAGALTFVLATSVLGVGLGLLLVLAYHLYFLLAFGAAGALLFAVHLLVVRSRKERSVGGEFLGIVALTMAAPVSFYAVSGEVARPAFLLWIMAALYFGASVFYVKMRVADSLASSSASVREARRMRVSLVAYLATALAATGILSGFGPLPVFIVTAFIPMTAYTLSGVICRAKRLSIRRLGFSLLGHSAVFTLVTIVIFVLDS